MSKKNHQPEDNMPELPPLDETIRQHAMQVADEDIRQHAMQVADEDIRQMEALGIELTPDMLDLLAWRRTQEGMDQLFGSDDKQKGGK
jgi:hypothetical protein